MVRSVLVLAALACTTPAVAGPFDQRLYFTGPDDQVHTAVIPAGETSVSTAFGGWSCTITAIRRVQMDCQNRDNRARVQFASSEVNAIYRCINSPVNVFWQGQTYQVIGPRLAAFRQNAERRCGA